jgi:hypothetical protein
MGKGVWQWLGGSKGRGYLVPLERGDQVASNGSKIIEIGVLLSELWSDIKNGWEKKNSTSRWVF